MTRSRILIGLAIALAACAAGCARKRVPPRVPDEPFAEAGASGVRAGSSGDSASAGSGGADADDASTSPSGGGGSMVDAEADLGDAGQPPDLPAPEPGIVAQGSLPEGIWIGEMRVAFGVWSSCSAVAQVSSRRVTLQIASTATEAARGTIIFGADQAVPAVDPEREYPPGISEERASCLAHSVLEGFPYALRDGYIDPTGRFHFRVAGSEPFIPWCEAQASLPFHEEETGYSCLPYGFPRYRAECAADAECARSLAEYAVCRSHCACAEQGCTANLNRVHRFDLQVEGDTMRGVISPVASEGGAIELVLRKAM